MSTTAAMWQTEQDDVQGYVGPLIGVIILVEISVGVATIIGSGAGDELVKSFNPMEVGAQALRGKGRPS